MLGLGAGIDYSLLIIGRYREQVAAGDSPRDASAKAAATSGRVRRRRRRDRDGGDRRPARDRHPADRQARHRGGDRRRRRRRVGADDPADHDGRARKRLRPRKPAHVEPSRAFARWGEIVTARPWLSIAAGVALLLVFAAPVTQLRLGQPDDGNQPTSKTQRVAYDQLSEAFGPGSNGPFLLAVDIPKGDAGNEAQLAELAEGGRRHARRGHRRARDAERGRRDGDDLRRSRRPRRRTPRRATCSSACART